MKRQWLIAVVCLAFTVASFAQDDLPTFKAGAKSALVWDKDLPDSFSSTSVWDPLTGHELHKLSHGGIEVTSRMGYERVSSGEVGKLLNYTTTIANHTDADVTVQHGGASVDGHVAVPLRVVPTSKNMRKRDRQNTWALNAMYCFKTGFASIDHYFSEETLTNSFTVPPQTAMTISAVVKDPRTHAVLCSVDGCQITGTIRYYITVNGKDYVFVWPGKSVVYCGK